MNDQDWIFEIHTEKDIIVLTFASYETASDFEHTLWIGLTNTEQEQIVKTCMHREMP